MTDTPVPVAKSPAFTSRPKTSDGKFTARAAQPPAAEMERSESPRLANGKKRLPLGQRKARLAYPPRPGFVRRWLNDEPGRIFDAENGGYAKVIDSESGVPVHRIVGVAKAGGGLSAYLMEIPEEFYNEDFLLKQIPLNEVDNQIKTGVHSLEADDKRYVPTTGIKIGVQRGSGRE